MVIKWGVIGACGIAERRTIPGGIAKAENSKLFAMMDIQQDKLKELGKKYPEAKLYESEYNR